MLQKTEGDGDRQLYPCTPLARPLRWQVFLSHLSSETESEVPDLTALGKLTLSALAHEGRVELQRTSNRAP